MQEFKINNSLIGEKHPVYIIAELSANHEQDLKLAQETIHAMKDSGADAVKLQTFTPDSITLNSSRPWFQTRKDSLWAGQKMYDLYLKAYTPWEWHENLKELTESLGMDFFSSPFDLKDVERLASIDVPAYKIASFEITDIPLIESVAKKQKPIILSTGVAEYDDIKLAVETCLNAGNKEIALLKCTSAYPTPMQDVNLSLIGKLKEDFPVIVGLSDHTKGIAIPVSAVTLGARIIEKHFILDKNRNGLDKEFSLDPVEFFQMVNEVRNVEQAIGEADYELTENMQKARSSARSLFAIKKINQGEELNADNIKSLRPALGLHPKHFYEILGKKALCLIEKGTPLDFNMIE